MSKKSLLFSIILLLAIVSVSFLSVNSINTNSVVLSEQNDDNIEISLNLKSSGYAVDQKWNVTTAEIVKSVAISADGRYMVFGTAGTGDANYELCLKKTSTNETIWTYNFNEDIYSVAISKYGDYIVCGGESPSSYPEYNLFLFDNSIPAGDKEPLWRYNTTYACYSVDISADGEYIVAGTESQGVLLFNKSVPMGEKTPHWQKQMPLSEDPECVAISTDGEYIVAGTRGVGPHFVMFFNNTFHLGTDKLSEWNYTTDVNVNSVAVSKYGDYIVAGCSDNAVGSELFIFNKSADNGQPEWSYNYGETRYILSVAISENGEYIATGEEGPAFWDGKVSLFNKSNSQREWTSSLEGRAVSVDITSDGEYIIAGTDYEPNDGSWDENTIFLYNKTANPIGNALPEWAFNTTDDVQSVSISSSGNYIGVGQELVPNGKAFMFYHARPISSSTIYQPSDDDDDDEEPAIPFGNYYLGFAILAIAALTLIYKRKTILNKR